MFDPVRIILSGVAINTVLGAYNAFLQMLNSDNLSNVLAFMNGSLSGCNWEQIYVISAYSLIGLICGFACIKSANILQLGDEMASGLGVNVSRVRILLSAVGAFFGGGNSFRRWDDWFYRPCCTAYCPHDGWQRLPRAFAGKHAFGGIAFAGSRYAGTHADYRYGNTSWHCNGGNRRAVLFIHAEKEGQSKWKLKA
mgnify:CR=1 FL=1